MQRRESPEPFAQSHCAPSSVRTNGPLKQRFSTGTPDTEGCQIESPAKKRRRSALVKASQTTDDLTCSCPVSWSRISTTTLLVTQNQGSKGQGGRGFKNEEREWAIKWCRQAFSWDCRPCEPLRAHVALHFTEEGCSPSAHPWRAHTLHPVSLAGFPMVTEKKQKQRI